MSVDVIREYVDPRRAAMQADYKNYVTDLNNSMKHKKTK